MKHLLTLCALALCALSVTAQDWIEDSVLCSTWAGSWQPSTRIYKDYDQHANLIEEVQQLYVNGSFINSLRTTFSYSGSAQLDTQLVYTWELSGWEPSSRTLYTYLGGNLVEEQKQSWSLVTTNWENSSRIVSTYSANNLEETRLFESYQSGAYIVVSLDSMFYDANDYLVAVRQYDDTVGWEPTSRWQYNRGTAGELFTLVEERWMNSAWELDNRHSYTYNALGDVTLDVRAEWENSSWEDQLRWVSTYDNNDNLATRTLQINIGGNWMDNQLCVSYWLGFVNVPEVQAPQLRVEAYPVPAANQLMVILPDDYGRVENIRVVDVRGAQHGVATQQAPEGVVLEVEQLPAGHYWLLLRNAEGKQVTGRFVVAH